MIDPLRIAASFVACTAIACGADDARSLEVVLEGHGLLTGQKTRVAVRDVDSIPGARSVVWASSDVSIATIDERGVIEGVGAGVVSISATAGALSGSVSLRIASFSEAVDALVFSEGRLRSSFPCLDFFGWRAFPLGSEVIVRISTVVSLSHRTAIEAASAQVPEATLGLLTVRIESTSDSNPIPNDGEVTVTEGVPPEGCLPQGCTIWSYTADNTIANSRVILPTRQTDAAFVHDVIGHGVLGLCHIDPKGIGGPQRSLMSFSGTTNSGAIPAALSPIDLAVVQASFGAGLSPGATRDEFVAAGILDPN